jgi:hypothetical protein
MQDYSFDWDFDNYIDVVTVSTRILVTVKLSQSECECVVDKQTNVSN